MKLNDFLTENKIGVIEFALMIGAKSRNTVYRYLKGRKPEDPFMERIVKVTGGKVTPNDFWLN